MYLAVLNCSPLQNAADRHYQSKLNFLIAWLVQIFRAFLQLSNALMTILQIMFQSNLSIDSETKQQKMILQGTFET